MCACRNEVPPEQVFFVYYDEACENWLLLQPVRLFCTVCIMSFVGFPNLHKDVLMFNGADTNVVPYFYTPGTASTFKMLIFQLVTVKYACLFV
jgi:hypothetical protein